MERAINTSRIDHLLRLLDLFPVIALFSFLPNEALQRKANVSIFQYDLKSFMFVFPFEQYPSYLSARSGACRWRDRPTARG